jgi:hypothetical protein
MFRQAMTGKKHVHRSDGDNITIKPKRGTSRAYTLDRLQRERHFAVSFRHRVCESPWFEPKREPFSAIYAPW